MVRVVSIIWLVLVLGVLALVGQALGWYDVPILRDLRAAVPFGQTPPPAAAEPTATIQPPLASPATVIPLVVRSPSPVVTDACTATTPRFVHGTAVLKASLGSTMGEPTECERVIDEAGNTEQKTTTGLAYYRAQSNIAAFTNGFDHWAVTSDGTMHWTSDDLEPPSDAEPMP